MLNSLQQLEDAVSQTRQTDQPRRSEVKETGFATPFKPLYICLWIDFVAFLLRFVLSIRAPGMFQGSSSQCWLTGGDLRSLEAFDKLASYNKRWL